MAVAGNASNSAQTIVWKHFFWMLLGVWLATLMRFPFQPLIHNISPFLFYLPVVITVAVVCGPRFGLLATVVSVLPANFFWMPPENAFEFNMTDFCQIVGFSIAGCSVSWLSHAVQRRKQLEEHLRATLACMGDAVITTDRQGRIVYLNAMAQVLTELQGQKPVGRTIGSALTLVAEDGRQMLDGTFQVAINNDEIESLPKRLIIVSESGRKYRVEQRTSRILDPAGRKIGTAILLHQLEADAEFSPARIQKKSEDPLNSKSELPRIAMVCLSGYAAGQPALRARDTGGQAYVLELSGKLAQLGCEVDIWTRQFEDQPAIEVVNERVRIIRMPCNGRTALSKGYLSDSLPQWNDSAAAFIQKHGLTYKFVSSHYWEGGLAGQQLSKISGVPHIHTPHALGIRQQCQPEADSPHDNVQMDENNLRRRIQSERTLYASADMVVATNAEQLNLLSSEYRVPDRKCRMIPPGYDDRRFYRVSEATREAIRNRLAYTSPVVQAVGQLTDDKGHELLIRAFAVVARRLPEPMLQLAVGGENLTSQEVEIFARLKALAGELDLTHRVQFCGCFPEDQLPDRYRAADVFVLSSRYEPFGISAVEAMACGAPTVLTVHGGLYQTISFGQHALYADPLDAEDLGMMIVKALSDRRLRLQLSRLGAEKARDSFSWSRVAQQFLDLVEAEKCRS